MSCLFCKIAAGEIPSTPVYQDELVSAFADINPMAPVHVLIVPREHIDSLDEAGKDHRALLGHLAWVAAERRTPILPMSWWWEFFDERQMTPYLARVRAMGDRMLKAGGGEFAQVQCRGQSRAPGLCRPVLEDALCPGRQSLEGGGLRRASTRAGAGGGAEPKDLRHREGPFRRVLGDRGLAGSGRGAENRPRALRHRGRRTPVPLRVGPEGGRMPTCSTRHSLPVTAP